VGNTVVLALAQVGGIAVSLLLTPYIVYSLGIERYGLWVLVSSIVAFAVGRVLSGGGSSRRVRSCLLGAGAD
jgi:O-antigen/teichoic acid export membrane protein